MSARHWASIGESTFVSGIWFMVGVHRLLGRRVFRLFLLPVVAWYWLAKPIARNASGQYLSRLQASRGALGHAPGARDEFRHLMTFAETVLDKTLAISGRYDKAVVDFQGQDELLAARDAGMGAVLVTAHMGCLEVLQAAANRREGLRITILVHTAHAQRFNRILGQLNPGTEVRLVQVTDFSPATVMMLADRVAAGEFVAIAGDRVPVQGDRVVRVPFLGVDAPLPIGPYLLASLLGCPAFLIGCLHHGDGYRVRVQKLADRVVLPRADREGALKAYAAVFAGWLEAQLAQSPFDWFNFYPFWDQIPHATGKN